MEVYLPFIKEILPVDRGDSMNFLLLYCLLVSQMQWLL